MKRYILYILLLFLCSTNVYSQSSPDSLNIRYVERLLNAESVPLLSNTYFVFVVYPYSVVVFEENKYYKLYYYKRDFDFNKQTNVFILQNCKIERVRKISMLYRIFNNQADCISEFIPDSLVEIMITSKPSNPFNYFVLYKEGQKKCEFNYPDIKLKTDMILRNKKLHSYMLNKLIKNAITPDFR